MMNIQTAIHAEWNKTASHTTARHANQSRSEPGQETNLVFGDGGPRLATQFALIFCRFCTKEFLGGVPVNDHLWAWDRADGGHLEDELDDGYRERTNQIHPADSLLLTFLFYSSQF
jgi:hypothetical protein